MQIQKGCQIDNSARVLHCIENNSVSSKIRLFCIDTYHSNKQIDTWRKSVTFIEQSQGQTDRQQQLHVWWWLVSVWCFKGENTTAYIQLCSATQPQQMAKTLPVGLERNRHP